MNFHFRKKNNQSKSIKLSGARYLHMPRTTANLRTHDRRRGMETAQILQTLQNKNELIFKRFRKL